MPPWKPDAIPGAALRPGEAFAYVEIGSDVDESASLWETYKAPSIDIPPLTEQNWRYQSRFTPDRTVGAPARAATASTARSVDRATTAETSASRLPKW